MTILKNDHKKNHRVLVVDDEAEIREIFRFALKEKVAVIEAADGSEARWKINNESFFILFLDLNVPKLSGLEILKNIHDATLNKPKHICVISAYIEDNLKLLFGKMKIDYLHKPFKIEYLEEYFHSKMNPNSFNSSITDKN